MFPGQGAFERKRGLPVKLIALDPTYRIRIPFPMPHKQKSSPKISVESLAAMKQRQFLKLEHKVDAGFNRIDKCFDDFKEDTCVCSAASFICSRSSTGTRATCSVGKSGATMESEFCVSALNQSLQVAKPEIFNTDQGSQFTSCAFTGILKEREIAISMDGRGRALDNIFVERLWRSVKYEDVYIHDYETAPQAIAGLGRYFKFYNRERLHQALDYKTPEAVYRLTA